MRRAVALGMLLFAVYAATIGLRAFGDSDYAGEEPHYLLAAKSIVDDRDVDLGDQYAARSYDSFYPYDLEQHGTLRKGLLYERHGVGFALMLAPVYGVGGKTGVELALAALAALAMALAYRLALRVVPDPWAIGAAGAVGLSPPLVAYSTTVTPHMTAALLLTGAALLAVRLDQRVSRGAAFACFGLLGLLPWLGLSFIPAGCVVGAFATRSILQSRRRTLALGSTEVAFFSLALFVGINEALYDGPTPFSADGPGGTATGADSVGDYLGRAYRLVALLLDRDQGLLRWAPVFALVFAGLWMLYRSRRDGLTRAMPQLRAMQRTGTLCATALGVQLLVAAFLAPTMYGFWFPARNLVALLPLAVPLVALGLRRLPRLGAALAALTAAGSVWLFVAVRFGDDGLVRSRPDAPFGPLTRLVPSFDEGTVWSFALAGVIGAALAALALLEARGRGREPAV